MKGLATLAPSRARKIGECLRLDLEYGRLSEHLSGDASDGVSNRESGVVPEQTRSETSPGTSVLKQPSLWCVEKKNPGRRIAAQAQSARLDSLTNLQRTTRGVTRLGAPEKIGEGLRLDLGYGRLSEHPPGSAAGRVSNRDGRGCSSTDLACGGSGGQVC